VELSERDASIHGSFLDPAALAMLQLPRPERSECVDGKGLLPDQEPSNLAHSALSSTEVRALEAICRVGGIMAGHSR
jgi:hypothetical protein